MQYFMQFAHKNSANDATDQLLQCFATGGKREHCNALCSSRIKTARTTNCQCYEDIVILQVYRYFHKFVVILQILTFSRFVTFHVLHAHTEIRCVQILGVYFWHAGGVRAHTPRRQNPHDWIFTMEGKNMISCWFHVSRYFSKFWVKM